MNASSEFDVECLATGAWNGHVFGTAELDQIVDNFSRLHPHGLRPPIKLGHGRQVLKQEDGDLSLGWVAAVRREGNKLLATLRDVPKVIVELIRKRRLARQSVELWPTVETTNLERNAKTGATGYALSALALLGIDPPACRSLADLDAYLASEGASIAAEPVGVLAFAEPRLLDDAGDADDFAALRTSLCEATAEMVREAFEPLEAQLTALLEERVEEKVMGTQQQQIELTEAERFTEREQVARFIAERDGLDWTSYVGKSQAFERCARERPALFSEYYAAGTGVVPTTASAGPGGDPFLEGMVTIAREYGLDLSKPPERRRAFDLTAVDRRYKHLVPQYDLVRR